MFQEFGALLHLHSFPTRRSSDLYLEAAKLCLEKGADVNAVNSQGFTPMIGAANRGFDAMVKLLAERGAKLDRSEEHTSELQSLRHLVCRLLLEKKNKKRTQSYLE